MSKQIGIVGWRTGDNSFGTTIPYLEFISKFGTPVILHPDTEVKDLDLLILPGGPDIDHTRYRKDYISLYVQKPCPVREHFDKYRLSEYIKRKTPIFGICRGMQSLAVFFKASLHQEMYHETSDDKTRYELVHNILITGECQRILKLSFNKVKVNSLHHQAIIRNTLPEELSVIAVYLGKLDNTVEAIAHTKLPIAGVQYHPEELSSDKLTESLIIKLLETKKSIF